ncbi:DNA-binding MarR family transcriptional regulator [Bacillus oleivorans]|uniref:DNA-binding MarR family transcriptional regulator n=1 Tax=Bacillus oleivorans TaxID=1448271 RepID=A0A285CSW4_9BACI|nr:MarR family transcriptional regulator [Bacillus oleivorans]SNX70670.1 DNA-binding MarR family transcriptional regulator [Bacillus oleivorans]
MKNNHDLFHTIHQLSRQLHKSLNEALQPFSIYSAQWSVLFVLKTKGNLTQSELCDYLSVEAPPMTRTIQRLIKQGYVKQIPSKEDKRVKYIQLTEKALAEYPEWEKAVLKMNESLLADFPKSSQEELRKLLREFSIQLRK